MKLILNSVAALVIVTASTATMADVEDTLGYRVDTVTEMVEIADLDLASPTDAQTLLKRIHRATKKVCFRVNEELSVRAMKDFRRCRTDSYERGIATINLARRIDLEALAGNTRLSREIVVAE